MLLQIWWIPFGSGQNFRRKYRKRFVETLGKSCTWGEEERVAFVAKVMKREREIRDWRPNYTSGKIELLLLRGIWRTFPTRLSILKLASRNVMRMVEESDDSRKKAKKNKRKTWNPVWVHVSQVQISPNANFCKNTFPVKECLFYRDTLFSKLVSLLGFAWFWLN